MRIDAIMNRRSIRRFAPRPVEREKLEAILRAAMQAPSGKNSQCWEFLVLEDRGDMDAVSTMSPYAQCARNAQAMIVVLGQRERIDPDVPIWIQDLSAATMNALTQIEAEGLGATWLCMYPFPERCAAMRDYFRLPDRVIPFCAIALGYKLQEKAPEDRYDPDRVHWGAY
ncbi:MAG: nitroreductase family protein [Oscillospiraceae bacterium]|nr:nitroreductase family protein [Oscillospiraceae bacterium]